MSDETGLAAALTTAERDALMAWWNSDWPRDGRDVLDTLADTVEGIFAARAARLSSPEAVEAVARAFCPGFDTYGVNTRWNAERSAEAALAAVRGLLGVADA